MAGLLNSVNSEVPRREGTGRAERVVADQKLKERCLRRRGSSGQARRVLSGLDFAHRLQLLFQGGDETRRSETFAAGGARRRGSRELEGEDVGAHREGGRRTPVGRRRRRRPLGVAAAFTFFRENCHRRLALCRRW
eukprot:CAMPEP_0118919762 /NCGR_PEP_ID=MMETSP1166-20130328/18705_1 /TAXON_ID=1104430 /ORGANISM="Chrysoreinhardia sp, Strain CCMP3193" /LENGTH=135 /DNA_ID=CAMNT_0006860295 /DNA_START=185 /DNA_END=589 /DNA_ORIENTATION=-